MTLLDAPSIPNHSPRGSAAPQAGAQRRPPVHRVGVRCKVLERIRDPRVDLTVWRRALPEGLCEALIRWVELYPASFDQICRPIAADLEGCLAGFESAPWRAWLLADLERRVSELQRLAGVERCRVVFGAVRGDQCRKFHVDKLRLRMISTYAGPGTEWAPEHAVRRAALSAPPACPDLANRSIIRRSAWVRHASAGDVLIMKGAWGGARGVVHRSPPIEALGALRVVLVASVRD